MLSGRIYKQIKLNNPNRFLQISAMIISMIVFICFAFFSDNVETKAADTVVDYGIVLEISSGNGNSGYYLN